MGRFDNYSMNTPTGYEERQAQIQKTMGSFDPADALEINFKWDGEYYFRVLPPLDLSTDWMVPRGWHWRLFPTGDEGKFNSKDGCPLVCHGEHCPVCAAIKKVVGEKGGDWKEFNGQNTIGVQKEYLLRILLIRVKNLKKSKGGEAPPRWRDGELPAIKVAVLKPSAASRLLELTGPDNDDYGWGKITHPQNGIVLKLTHDSEKEGAKQYNIDPVMEIYPLPDDVISDEAVDRWPVLQKCLPALNSRELLAKIEKHQMDIDARIANAVLAIDMEYGEVRQLESGGANTAEPTKVTSTQDMAALKNALAQRKGKAKA